MAKEKRNSKRWRDKLSSFFIPAPPEVDNTKYRDADYNEVFQHALTKGYLDPSALRELLIATTSVAYIDEAMDYLREHYNDPRLLSMLFDIATEGEDMGDAPWAAANVIEEFPPEMLKLHESQLEALSKEQWDYLNVPARRALAKL